MQGLAAYIGMKTHATLVSFPITLRFLRTSLGAEPNHSIYHVCVVHMLSLPAISEYATGLPFLQGSIANLYLKLKSFSSYEDQRCIWAILF